MPTSPTPAKAPPGGRELPLAPHLSEPLERPWLHAYDHTLTRLHQRLGKTLATLTRPAGRRAR